MRRRKSVAGGICSSFAHLYSCRPDQAATKPVASGILGRFAFERGLCLFKFGLYANEFCLRCFTPRSFGLELLLDFDIF
jgi:hypothetical protein